MDRMPSAILRTTARGKPLIVQTKEVKDIFPFLELPAELRNKIYYICFDNMSGVQYFFNAYHYAYGQKIKAIAKAIVNMSSCPPYRCNPSSKIVPNRKTPIILILNTQISHEALHILRDCTVTFHHGLFKIESISRVISPSILQRVAQITVSDAGHPILLPGMAGPSWEGYTRLLQQLGEVLAKGHALKKFALHLSDGRLAIHMASFHEGRFSGCHYCCHLRHAVAFLRGVRGVGEVSIRGLNVEWARELKERMESTG